MMSAHPRRDRARRAAAAPRPPARHRASNACIPTTFPVPRLGVAAMQPRHCPTWWRAPG
jgi:hypothetical protein